MYSIDSTIGAASHDAILLVAYHLVGIAIIMSIAMTLTELLMIPIGTALGILLALLIHEAFYLVYGEWRSWFG